MDTRSARRAPPPPSFKTKKRQRSLLKITFLSALLYTPAHMPAHQTPANSKNSSMANRQTNKIEHNNN